MAMMQGVNELIQINACNALIIWASKIQQTIEKQLTIDELFDRCNRSEWLIWILIQKAGQNNWPSKESVDYFLSCDIYPLIKKKDPQGIFVTTSFNAVKKYFSIYCFNQFCANKMNEILEWIHSGNHILNRELCETIKDFRNYYVE